MADMVSVGGITPNLPNRQSNDHVLQDAVDSNEAAFLSDQWWKDRLEGSGRKALATIAGMLALGAVVIPAFVKELSERSPVQATQSVDGEPAFSFGSQEELLSAITAWLPEQLAGASSEAEGLIYQTIRNNEPGAGESVTLEEQNSWIWRGAVLVEVGVSNDSGKQGNAWLRLDNPYEVTVDNKVYWVANYPGTEQLLTVHFGDRTASGGINVNQRYLLSEPRPYINNSFSGQRVSAKPLSYDPGGLVVQDNYELLLRDGPVQVLSSASFYLSKEDAAVGLGDPLYIGTDTEAVNRDHNALQD